MIDQLFAALLFLFGFAPGGSIRGESTSSAVLRKDIVVLEKNFLEKRKNAELNLESKRASFSASLAFLKDEKKKTLLEAMQNRLYEINKNQCTIIMVKLKRLSLGVEEIQKNLENYAKEKNTDVTSVSAAIQAANSAIADAMAIVALQGEKTYFMTVTTEANLKKDFETERTLLVADLKKSRNAFQNARKKVAEALKALRALTGKPEKIFIPSQENTDL